MINCYTSGTTGLNKRIPYGKEEFDRIRFQIEWFFKKIGFNPEGKNTYSVFPRTAPNLATYQTEILKEYANHNDIGGLVKSINDLQQVVGLLNLAKQGKYPEDKAEKIEADLNKISKEGEMKFNAISKLIGNILQQQPPDLIAGDPTLLTNFISLVNNNIPAGCHIVTGNDRPTETLKKLCDQRGYKLSSIYGRTEQAMCLVTEEGKWEEGYCYDRDDVKLEFGEDNEIIVNGQATGDCGFINKFNKLDLQITRFKSANKCCGQ